VQEIAQIGVAHGKIKLGDGIRYLLDVDQLRCTPRAKSCATMLPVNLSVPITTALRLPLRWLPDALHAQVFARAFNHLMRGQALARRLPALDGRVVRIEVSDVPCRVDLAIRGESLHGASGRAPDVTVRGPLADFWKLATRAEDPDTLFFQRRLAIEGDTETGLHLKNLLDALDYDLEAHVHAVLGERLSRPAFALLSRLPRRHPSASR
jgi:predicted lipid carrier protein YhbT